MLNIRVVGERLPGRTVGGRSNVHIGLRRADAIVQQQPADAASVKFAFGIVVRAQEDGSIDFRSPFVHGQPADRSIWLAWGEVAAGAFSEFGRLELMLSAVPAGLVTATTGTLEAYLGLTDADGRPLAGAVRPPAVNWSSRN